MDLLTAIKERHSVRSYLDRPLEPAVVERLQSLIAECNRDGDLNIQLVLNEPHAFGDSRMAHYGKFSGVTDYIALIGRKSADLSERAGYYGEKIVLAAQCLGLNTCWVALTFKKIPDVMTIGESEKLVCVISIGYGTTQGPSHKVKTPEKVSDTPPSAAPEWYRRGLEAALLAPTAINQQQFAFRLTGERTVSARAKLGFYAKVDLGIVKYHFELGAGKENFTWV